ncbi:HAD-IA family hydrolase [uncultured Tateyamaria sp.]|uniref:HAD-IA family hydrolase n=1 Tax=uncultured Tateyamaria sp. TaxID=455651 RepID=UPI002610CDE4|nr:HAD-IA family hydrolase [uncultured Tateyamaria sp.]
MRLVIFDVDGTLVDSQGDIVASMTAAFEDAGLPVPVRSRILSIVGLSLDVAMGELAPGADTNRMVRVYKDAYAQLRVSKGAASSPLYPGARAALDHFAGRSDLVMGVATGKSKRGLDGLIEAHGLEDMFVTRQVADFHPSKPHPSMIHTALDETGVAPGDAVMIGDTRFDMEMAANAGVAGIGVTWGYHPRTQLGAARHIIEDFRDLAGAVDALWEGRI